MDDDSGWRRIAQASALLTSCLDVDEVLGRVLPLAAELTGAEGSSVILHDPESHELVVAAASGPKAKQILGKRFPETAGIAGEVLRTGEPRLIADAQGERAHLRDIDRATGHVTHSLLAAPLVVRSARLGVVEVVNRMARAEREPRSLAGAEGTRSNRSGGGTFGPEDLARFRVLCDVIAAALENARLYSLLARENETLRRTSEDRGQLLVSASSAMARVLDQADRAAAGRSTVLLMGETGTGKELLARRIHERSPRARKPFVALNCGALPESLLESELFGHERGAFTGADRRRLGRFELAEGGTLFLDEIGELPPGAQVKLLRVLQEREFVRVGGDETVRADVRLIAATHRDLESEVRAGRFREDLFFRVNVLPLHLPPLRERPEDIAPLAELFLDRFSREMGRRPRPLAPETVEILVGHDWRGNVRELQNLIERVLVLGDEGPVRPEEVSELLRSPSRPSATAAAPPTSGSSLAEQERRLLAEALARGGGNQSQAARLLKISRDQLRTRLKRHGLLAKPGA